MRDEEGIKPWEKKFFVVKRSGRFFILEYFEKEGGVMEGLLECSSGHVSSSDDKRGIKLVITSSGRTSTWRLKAFSAEQQYKWVQALTEACESVSSMRGLHQHVIIAEDSNDSIEL